MSKRNNSDFMVKYTNKDIMQKLEDLHEEQTKILEQTKKTNGRVTNLEKRSIGMWVSNNTLKFIIISLMLMGLFIKETRDLIIHAIISAFIG